MATAEPYRVLSFDSFLKEYFAARHILITIIKNKNMFKTEKEKQSDNESMYINYWELDNNNFPVSTDSNKDDSIFSSNQNTEVNEILIPKGSKYISQLPSDILIQFNNCIINKQVCGCGFTNYYLNIDIDCIIAVPNVELITNKASQLNNNNLLGVFGSIGEEEIINFWNDSNLKYKKILCTYNALEKVVNAIDNVDNVFNIKLVIDEYQVFITDTIFRKGVLKQTLRISQRFKNKVYISATPIKRIYLPDELQELPIIRLTWEDFQRTKIRRHTSREYKSELRKLISNRIKNKTIANLYIFCNSITWIMQMITALNLSKDEVKIVCSKSNANNSKATKGYPICGLDDKDENGYYKPINFITSTAFAGCDCYDENGRIIVVSDSKYCSTMLDISLQIAQIAGRLRCTRYKEVIHYCSDELRYDNVINIESFQKKVEQKLFDSQQIASRDYDSNNNTERKIRLKQKDILENDAYLQVDKTTGELSVDTWKAKFDMWCYESMKVNYYSSESYKQSAIEAGFNVEEISIQNEFPSDRLMKKPHSKVKLSEALWEYLELSKRIKHTNNSEVSARMNLLERKYPDLPFMMKIGYKKVKELNFSVKRVLNYKRSIINNNMHNSLSEGIKNAYKIQINGGTYIPYREVKQALANIYKELDINKIASAEAILDIFPKSIKTKRLINGKQQRCIRIIIE